jgi:chromosome segregation ATPase
MDATPHAPPRPDLPAPAGELIVQNGRLSGARRALGAALTLFGRAEGCDVRLNVEGVLPIHCAVVRTPDGFALRALHGAPTQLNGEPVSESPLRNDDVLTVGPFQFRVALPLAPEPIDRASLEREKDALRIQAAAVAAQQAALTEEEARLQHRRATLERQEAQLSAHLEERRRKLVELQAQVREARMALRNEQTEHKKSVAETTAELVRKRGEIEAANEKLRGERRQLTELHRRLQQRHARHWQSAEAAMHKREERLAAERHKLDADRAALNDARLRFNGEAELGRRQLHAAWDEFRRAQKQWEARRAQECADLRVRDRELDDSERALCDEWQHWEETRRTVRAEVEGLESRVRNLRRKVYEQEMEAKNRGDAPATVPAESVPTVVPARAELAPEQRERLAELEVLAEALADQRLHMLEQAARLVRAEEQWRADHAAALAELEEAARRLQLREEQMEPRDRALTEAETELRRRGEAAAQLQAHLDGWQARLTAREAAWDADREALLVRVRVREDAAQGQAEALADLRQRWEQRWKKELAALRGALKRCEAARRQYGLLWEECLNHGAALEQQQRALAERALALEQYRLELIGRAPDSAAAEKRLERLRRRCAAATAAARRNLDRERQALDAERKRLQSLAQRIDGQTAALAGRETALTQRLAEWESGQASAEAARTRLQTELGTLTAQRAHREREAQALRDELERLARLLIDDGPTLLPVVQAA